MRSFVSSSAFINRRRFITIAAAVAGASALPRRTIAWTATWSGIALGAPATLTLQHPDEAEAKDAIAACLAEVGRLEAIFSLYRPDSALMRLNVSGRLDDAPADLRIVLTEALMLAARTRGAFDPSIQPLWALYARHFSTPGASPAGPDTSELASALALVDWRNVRVEDGSIVLRKPGMEVTLNGIAQGYITDKVGDILRGRGFAHVLIDMGEQLALAPKWDGTSWRVGVLDPIDRTLIIECFPLATGAVATSSNLGTHFDKAGRIAHILDPHTGRPAARWASVTVTADRATRADGLSTALSLLPESSWRTLLAPDARVFVVPLGGAKGYWV